MLYCDYDEDIQKILFCFNIHIDLLGTHLFDLKKLLSTPLMVRSMAEQC